MAKLLKIIGRIIGISFEWLFILIIVFAFSIRTSTFQTYLGKMVTDFLSKELEAEFRIGKIDVVFFDKIYLHDVFVRDQHADTLASLAQIMVRVKDFSFSGDRIELRSVNLLTGKVGIERDSINGDYNYEFIADYFSGNKTKTKGSDPPKVTIEALNIENVDVSYDDYRKGYNTFGMDYDHLDLKNIYLHISGFTEEAGIVHLDIDHLSAYEKSGFWLNKLQAHLQLDPNRGMLFSKVKITTSRSKIYSSKLHFLMSDFEGLQSFEDSVTFDAVLDSSSVNMRDISLFGTALEGMNEQVQLSGKVTRKVKDLLITDLDLRFGERTVLRGDYSLPDFRNISTTGFKEWVDYAYIDFRDIERLTLPKDAGIKRINLDVYLDRLGYAEVKQMYVHGSVNAFNIKGNKLATNLGSVRLPNELHFAKLPSGGYGFKHTENTEYDIYVDTFNLGGFLDNSEFGYVKGQIWADGIIGEHDLIRLTQLTGNIEAFNFHQYTYHQINVTKGSLVDNVLDAHVVVNDPNLAFIYSGKIEVNKIQDFDFNATITKANLGKINFSDDPKSFFTGNLTVDMRGSGFSDYDGLLFVKNLDLTQYDKHVYVPILSLNIDRGDMKDVYDLQSSILDATLSGKMNFESFVIALNNGLSDAFPAYFKRKKFPNNKHVDNFTLDLVTKSTDDVLDVFFPKLSVDNGTEVHFEFNSGENYERLRLNSSRIAYQDLVFKDKLAYMTDISLEQEFKDGKANMLLDAGRTSISDSLFVSNLKVQLDGTGNKYESVVDWNQRLKDSAEFLFSFDIVGQEEFQINLHKNSYFGLKGNQWEMFNTSSLNIQPNRYEFDHLMLERNAQFLAVNGVLSDKIEDKLHIRANDLHLNEFTSLLGVTVDLEGNLDSDVTIQTPFTDFKANGEVLVRELKVKKTEIGDVHVFGDWIDAEKKFNLTGDLHYLKNETFDFTGNYYPFKEKNSLDFEMLFKDMDLAFTNAFIDEEVISEIKGKVRGEVKVTGELDNIQIDGETDLVNAGLKVGILGTSYSVSGPIKFDGQNDGIFGVFPVTDEEGNQAYAIATIFHNDFKDFSINFDVTFDETARTFSNPLSGEKLNYTGRFLGLNTAYDERSVYYGKAYVSGSAAILIEEGQTVINVDVATEKGTEIKIPMYGAKEVSEFDFITFNKDSLLVDPKVDLTGVDLNLSIHATPLANIELILNPQTDEIIHANGSGKINIRADNYGQVKMDGVYEINSGDYNFVLGVIRKPFKLVPGGTISWSGDPLEAGLDISTYYSVMASLAELNPDLVNSDNISKKEVRCMLDITQTLSNPNIQLDIQVPGVTESERPALERIRGDKDELQKQFFTLLIARRFQGHSTNSTNQNGLADVLAQQLNYLLDQMSKNVKMNVAYDNNTVTGDKKFQFGVERAFGDKKNIILKTSLGVNNNSTTGSNTSSLIGDFSLDYLITDDGGFRVTIFNESNDKGVLSNKDKGDFTQGVGLHYQESFNEVSESRIIEFFANAFRKKENKKVKNSKRKKRVPVAVMPTPPAIIKDEESSDNP